MFYAIVVVIALILDQMVKYWATVNIVENTGVEQITQPLIPGLIHLTNYHNTGAAFGFLQNASWSRWFFVVLCGFFVAVVIYVLLREMISSPGARWAAVIVVAGAIGNCVDRVITGYVVDMLEFDFKILGHSFPIFNIADMYITLGVIAFCVFTLLEKPKEPAAAAARAGDAPEGARSHVRAPEPARQAEVVPFPEQKAPEQERDLFEEWQEQADTPQEPEPPKQGTGKVTYTQPEQDAPTVQEPQSKHPKRVRHAAAGRLDLSHEPSKTEQVMRTLVTGKPAEEAPPAPEQEPVMETPPQPAPAPAPRPEPPKPEPAPAPKQDTDEVSYNLDDILAEFRDL